MIEDLGEIAEPESKPPHQKFSTKKDFKSSLDTEELVWIMEEIISRHDDVPAGTDKAKSAVHSGCSVLR